MKVKKLLPVMVSSLLVSALIGISTEVSSKSNNSNHSKGESPEWIACGGGGGGGGGGNAKKKRAEREAKLKLLMEMEEAQDQD
ncbi:MULTISPECIES: hypothetical protein [Prochlorococcus]|uniref:hypothetical protein n=1 Tax=Prochlorococcus TaxID=1218 RepID=UPI000533A4C7|nr:MULTISPECIES: hypothetical protein [Prochlorococcus]KGG11887.1 hypothetical protein EV05_1088 [Prochlorococcus sp. MIT 0601]